MTAEQLEALADGIHPDFMGMDCEEAITYLARRVIDGEGRMDRMRHVLAKIASHDIDCVEKISLAREASK